MSEEFDEINQIMQHEFDTSDDIPPPETTVQQNFSKPTIMEAMKHVADNVIIGKGSENTTYSHNINEIPLPEQSKQPLDM